MQLQVLDRHGVRIVECVDAIGSVGDALDLIAACMERHATRLLLESRNLPLAFFDLRSGFAGEFVQKLQNYHIRLAGVFPSDLGYSERFCEFLSEAKRGRSFRVFAARSEAEAWLVGE
jgi:uncharacterized protein DUF4180